MKRQLFIFVLILLPFISFGQTKIHYKTTDSCVIYAPNVATPDCDAVGCDYFHVYCNCEFSIYEITIYNKFGEAIFQTTNPKEGWYIGNNEDGNYVWVLKGVYSNGQIVEAQGSVYVLK